MATCSVSDIAKRFDQNPLLKQKDIKASNTAMKVECLLNPGVFRFDNKIWLLVRVAERPEQFEGHVVVPIYNEKGEMETIRFSKNDPNLDLTDSRVISYKENHT